jgi:hypothetical protein
VCDDRLRLTADLFISLDGFAGAVDFGPYFGYGGPELDQWIQAQTDKPQVIVFERVTSVRHARSGSVCKHSRETEHDDQRRIVELDHAGNAGGGWGEHHDAV